MLSADEIYDALIGLSPEIKVRVLALIEGERIYQAEQILMDQWGPGHEAQAREVAASIYKSHLKGKVTA